MRKTSIAEQDDQARDLEAAAVEMRALADQLKHAPVPVVELIAELGEDADRLTRQLATDVYRDDIGRRVVTRQRARVDRRVGRSLRRPGRG